MHISPALPPFPASPPLSYPRSPAAYVRPWMPEYMRSVPACREWSGVECMSMCLWKIPYLHFLVRACNRDVFLGSSLSQKSRRLWYCGEENDVVWLSLRDA